MSAQDLETVRAGVEAYNGRDIDEMVRLCSPEIRMKPIKALLEGGEYTGHEGVRQFFAEMDEDWAERGIVVDEVREVGDRFVVLGTFRAVGRSGTEVSYPMAWLSDVRDGLLVSMRAYTDPEAALREAGSP